MGLLFGPKLGSMGRNTYSDEPWSDEANAAMAFDTLTESSYLEPREPDIPINLIIGKDDMSTVTLNMR